PNSEFFKSSVDVFSIHGLFTRLPRRLMPWLCQELLEKIIMPKLMIGCQGQWRAGPMNRIIFQPDGTRMVPIFHHSIVPLFQL
ncbi:MAG: hypothetical protein V3V39_01075, partial [Desulfobacterales bacterium]